ncbi:cation channel sperm-associated auxiliary subunit beta-like [Antedon mediterranea]|uniref:cation channel sperm-associated auxiliary subunit beta-like n=1 Tax=Antedon mediterranea TaxID=105859 RepID=UPI003AF8C339
MQNIICDAVDEDDDSVIGNHALSESLFRRGHTPTLHIFNSTWSSYFHFPRIKRNVSNETWMMTIPRSLLSNLKEDFYEEFNVHAMLDYKMEVFTTKASLLDLNKEAILQWHLGEVLDTSQLLVTSINDIKLITVVSSCAPDVVLVAVAGIPSVLPICVSYANFMDLSDTSCYDLSQAICPDCSNLILLDMELTSTYLVVFTNYGVFVSKEITDFYKGYKLQLMFNYIHINDIEQESWINYELMHTSECQSALSVGLVSYECVNERSTLHILD